MRLQLDVYICSHCKKILSLPEIGKEKGKIEEKLCPVAIPHLSIKFTSPSGYVEPNKVGVWKQTRHINPDIYQFCDEKCLAKFVKKLLYSSNSPGSSNKSSDNKS